MGITWTLAVDTHKQPTVQHPTHTLCAAPPAAAAHSLSADIVISLHCDFSTDVVIPLHCDFSEGIVVPLHNTQGQEGEEQEVAEELPCGPSPTVAVAPEVAMPSSTSVVALCLGYGLKKPAEVQGCALVPRSHYDTASLPPLQLLAHSILPSPLPGTRLTCKS